MYILTCNAGKRSGNSRGRGARCSWGWLWGSGGDRCADWLSEGRWGWNVLTAARLAEALPCCFYGWHHHSVFCLQYILCAIQSKMWSALCHWNICSHQEALMNSCSVLLTGFAPFNHHLFFCSRVVSVCKNCTAFGSVKKAVYTKWTEFSWTLATRWILCVPFGRPHNKPFVDVWKMFMYLKTKVIRASGSHLSSCVFPQTQTHPLFFKAFP